MGVFELYYVREDRPPNTLALGANGLGGRNRVEGLELAGEQGAVRGLALHGGHVGGDDRGHGRPGLHGDPALLDAHHRRRLALHHEGGGTVRRLGHRPGLHVEHCLLAPSCCPLDVGLSRCPRGLIYLHYGVFLDASSYECGWI